MEILRELIFDLWPVKCPRSWFMYSCSCCVHLGYGSGFSPWTLAVVVSLGCCAEWNQAAKPQVHLLPDPLHCSCGTADPEARYWNFLRMSLLEWKTNPWGMLISSPALCSFTLDWTFHSGEEKGRDGQQYNEPRSKGLLQFLGCSPSSEQFTVQLPFIVVHSCGLGTLSSSTITAFSLHRGAHVYKGKQIPSVTPVFGPEESARFFPAFLQFWFWGKSPILGIQ